MARLFYLVYLFYYKIIHVVYRPITRYGLITAITWQKER